MIMKNKTALNRIKALEEKSNARGNDDFVRHVYTKLVFDDMSEQRLREIIALDKLDLAEVTKEINELITRDILKNCFLSEDLNVKTGDAELTKILESLENRDALFEALPDYIQYKGAKIAKGR